MKITCFFSYDHIVRSESWQNDQVAVSSYFFFSGTKEEAKARIKDMQRDSDNLNIRVSDTEVVGDKVNPTAEIYSWTKDGDEFSDFVFWYS
jgi:hypothetical protein